MVDVDRLKEALTVPMVNDDLATFTILDAEAFVCIEAAARLVVTGQPLWWCEEHKSSLLDANSLVCDLYLYVVGHPILPCRMVEGWWMPTGGSE